MSVINYHTDKQAWLDERLKGIGASEASAMLGLNPFCTPFKLWATKTGLYEAEELTAEAVKWGQRLETPIALGYAEEKGLEISQAGDLIKHDASPLFATPDYYIGENGVLECKLTNDYNGYANDNTPDYVQIQVAVQLLCTGREFAHIAALLRGTKLLSREFTADLELQSVLANKANEFWKLVETRTPPPLLAQDADIIPSLYPTVPELSKELDASLDVKIQRYLDTKLCAKNMQDKADQLQAELRMALGEAARGTTPSGHTLVSSIINTTRVDTTRLKADAPLIYQTYSKTTKSERFSVKLPR